jgi:hypothetical protein
MFPQGKQLYVFFNRCEDLFGDFFDVLRHLADRDPYTNLSSYLPLVCMMLYPFSILDDYSHMTLVQAWGSKIGMVSAFLFIFFSCCTLLFTLYKLTDSKKHNILFVALLSLSGVFLFSIERANTIILTAGFLSLFLLYHNSDNKILRLTGLVFLCLATVFKVYPVLFGLILLKQKRYKDILFCIVTTFLLTFVPFLFFKHGFNNVGQLFNNLSTYGNLYAAMSDGMSIQSLTNMIIKLGFLPLDKTQIFHLSYGVTLIIVLFTLFIFFKTKDNLVELFLITCMVIMLPTNSPLYTGLYFFPIILIFLNKDQFVKLDYLYAFLFIVFLNPFQFYIFHDRSINTAISCLCLLSIWIITLVVNSGKVLTRK